MTNKAYIINFDKGGILDSFNYNKFHENLTTANGVLSWWHYLQNSYIIVTNGDVTATRVSNLVQRLMPNKNFIVLEVILENHNGWLPKEAWDWIAKNK